MRCFHQRGTMPSAPIARPPANAASTTRTSGAVHDVPKKKCTVASCWLFSAKANRVKKMAALSSHVRYFIGLLAREELYVSALLQFGGALVDRFAQGLARLEMG